MMPAACPWCTQPSPDDPDPDLLCEYHIAEYEGLSVQQYQRRDRIEFAEWLDATHG